jgi:hypothetical protein
VDLERLVGREDIALDNMVVVYMDYNMDYNTDYIVDKTYF